MSTIPPIVKTVAVPTDPATAFTLFTRDIGSWWPLERFSAGAGPFTGVAVDEHVGGELAELTADGARRPWGTFTAWEPPTRVAFTWHPGTDPAVATNIEVTFTGSSDKTTVTLTHSNWEQHPGGNEAWSRYESGWDLVIARYVAAA